MWLPRPRPDRRAACGNGSCADLARVCTIAAAHLTVPWCLQPPIVYAGPSCVRLIERPLETWLLVIVPFFPKVGLSFVDLSLLRRLARGEEVEVFEPHAGKPLRP